MTHKLFAERLNRALDDIGVPEHLDERIDALAKLLKIHRFKADSLLQGQIFPDKALLEKIAAELEVDAHWLLGTP